MARKAEDRTFNVSVLGLSGTEQVKGPVGVGKSCLCNRFISEVADKYNTEHISVLSPSDFSSRVINNDHFLYWGETTKTDEGSNFTFHVIEQTEFTDDVSFQTFKTGRLDSYYKRAVQTKVQSSEKFMYICKDQLGMETDSVYEQKVMPEGKLTIDGFICCFDVSRVPNRQLKDQVEFVVHLLNGAVRTKKPVVLVATKTDDADELYRKELEKIITRKEYRNSNIPIVETSAHENVNIEQAFLVLAHLIDKTKSRYKITPFNDAVKQRKDLLDIATDAYKKLLRLLITDSKMAWNAGRKKIEKDPDFDHYVDLFGTDSAKKLFRLHVKQLRDEQIRKREQHFLSKLPDLLQHYLPDLATIGDKSWTSCIRYIQDHPDFHDHFIVVCDDGDSWKYTQHFVDNYTETRLPRDLLTSTEAEMCFRNHRNALQAEFEKLELKKNFRKALEENPQVTPGKTLEELEIFFLGKDCFVKLKPHEREQVFTQYHNDLKLQAKSDFQELLWERLDTFIRQRLLSNSSVQEDIQSITADIQDDTRYRRLDKLQEERQVMLINHLGFMECPMRDRCYFHENCAETQVQSVMETASKSINRDSQRISNVPEVEKQLNLVLLGNEGLANEVCKEIRTLFPSDKFMYYDMLFSLDYRPIEDDVSLEYNAFQTDDFKPQGCICVYSTSDSLEYLNNSLEMTLKPDLTPEGKENTLKSLPVIIIQYPNSKISEKEQLKLRDRGKDLAHVYHGEFIDIPSEEDPETDASQIELALLSLVRDTTNGHPHWSDEPELRIGMCMMCGDEYDVEIPLGPLLNSNPTQIESENEYNSIVIEANIDNNTNFTKKKIEVVVGSYHNFVARVFKDEEDDYQGFVLVYSPKRKASFCTMKALADNLRRFSSIIPIMVLAVTDSGISSMFTDEGSKELILEGSHLEQDLGCEFHTTSAAFKNQSPIYMSFFRDAWSKRDELGESYYTDPNSPPYDVKIDKRPPAPLPKYDTCQTTKSSTSNSQSTEDSEPIYDQPTGYVPQSDSEHERPSSASPPSYRPPSPANGELSREQLVRPSMMRKRQGANAAYREHCRRSFPVIEADAIRLQSYKSLEQPEPEPHYQFKKSYSMKLAMKEEEEAWALNEPRKQKKAATFPSDVRQNLPENEGWNESSSRQSTGSRNSEDVIFADNDLYHSFCEPPKPQILPGRRTSNDVQAPLAQQEPDITLQSEYAVAKDVIKHPFLNDNCEDSDYALVGDALPKGKLQRILSQDQKMKKEGTDSDDSEFSSLEREPKEMTIYSRVNRKPTPHKKKTKQKSSVDGQIYTIPVYTDEREKTHLGIRRNHRGHYREKTYESVEKYREYQMNTMPKTGMTASMDGDYDINHSPNWIVRTMNRRGKNKEEKKVKKEEEKKQKEQQKLQKKKKKAEPGCIKLQDCVMSSNNPSLPQFVETCVEFLEEEGMNTEGIYRIPGNKQQVVELQNRLQEDSGIDIHTVEDIQVNAVATVLKSFLNETEPLIPSALHDELLEAAGIPEKSPKLIALRGVLKKLYPTNYEVLKYFITHLNRVSQHSYKHNMDAKNLALCLWPTLFRIDFTSYAKMAQGTKYPPEIVQVLIEQCGFFFHGENELDD